MTIWVLHVPLTPEEEERIAEREELPLPLSEYPDFTLAKSQGEYRKILATLHSDLPPESMRVMLEKSWGLYSAVHQEDVIAVPLSLLREVALAQVTGAYVYRSENGGDTHSMPVTWSKKRISLKLPGKHKDVFLPHGVAMVEVTEAQTRALIRDKMPYSYNRFSGWKWILALLFALGLISRLTHRLNF